MKSENRLLLSVVLGLLGLTGLFVGAVAIEVVKASGDRAVRHGLDYDHFLSAVDELLDGVGDSELVGFDVIEEVLPGGRAVTYDTLVIHADPDRFPSFQPAGFLYDQVHSYNNFQRERVSLGMEDPEWFDRVSAFNPSVFRSYRRADGSTGLTRSAAAWTLRVGAPLEGEWMGEIQAREVHRGAGLLGPHLAISLRRPTRLVRTANGRRQRCDFAPGVFDVQAFCLSEQRIPQATLRLASAEATPNRAVAGWTDLWVDGSRVAAGDSVSVREGSVLQIAPLEPLVVADYWEGVLSSKQWINGRTRRIGAFQPPLDMFASLGRRAGMAGELVDLVAPVALSVDAGASVSLTETLRRFASSEIDLPLDFGLVVVARVPDGEIVAIAEVGDRRSPGRSNLLEPVLPGSAVKPLLAAAILSERPELASLRIPARSGSVTRVLGLPALPAKQAFSSSLNCTPPEGGWLDLDYFIRCSNNEYAANLLAASLWESDEWVSVGRGSSAREAFRVEGRPYSGVDRDVLPVGGSVGRSRLLLGPVSEGLNNLFDVATDPVITDATRRSHRFWEGLSFRDGGFVPVPSELLPAESRPALLGSSDQDGTDLSLLYRYAFGAWENRWTLLDLANGFGRLATDRRVQLRFAATSGTGRTDVDALGLRSHEWYSTVLGALRGVPRDGTGRGLATAWRRAGLPSGLLAKTGTLAEPGQPGRADDLFSKSLLFAVGEDSARGDGSLTCGLVGGVYLRFAEGPRSGRLPSYQLDFAERRLGAFLEAHWEDWEVCEGREN